MTKSDDPKRTITLIVRLTLDEHERFRARCNQLRVPMAGRLDFLVAEETERNAPMPHMTVPNGLSHLAIRCRPERRIAWDAAAARAGSGLANWLRLIVAIDLHATEDAPEAREIARREIVDLATQASRLRSGAKTRLREWERSGRSPFEWPELAQLRAGVA